MDLIKRAGENGDNDTLSLRGWIMIMTIRSRDDGESVERAREDGESERKS